MCSVLYEHMFAKLAVLLIACALLVGVLARPSGGSGTPRTYLVKPTDTLWSLAVARYAGDPRDGVWRIQQRNHLSRTTLVPGQLLVLP